MCFIKLSCYLWRESFAGETLSLLEASLLGSWQCPPSTILDESSSFDNELASDLGVELLLSRCPSDLLDEFDDDFAILLSFFAAIRPNLGIEGLFWLLFSLFDVELSLLLCCSSLFEPLSRESGDLARTPGESSLFRIEGLAKPFLSPLPTVHPPLCTLISVWFEFPCSLLVFESVFEAKLKPPNTFCSFWFLFPWISWLELLGDTFDEESFLEASFGLGKAKLFTLELVALPPPLNPLPYTPLPLEFDENLSRYEDHGAPEIRPPPPPNRENLDPSSDLSLWTSWSFVSVFFRARLTSFWLAIPMSALLLLTKDEEAGGLGDVPLVTIVTVSLSFSLLSSFDSSDFADAAYISCAVSLAGLSFAASSSFKFAGIGLLPEVRNLSDPE